MTDSIWNYFKKNAYIQSLTKQANCKSPNDIGRYGTIILSRYPCQFYECDFKSNMGRSLILAEPCTPFHLIVATSHFESLNSAHVRIEQLMKTFKVLKAAQGEEF